MNRLSVLRRFADLSLKRKLTAMNLIGALFAGALVCVALGALSWQTLSHDLLRNERSVAQMLAKNAASAIQLNNPVVAGEVLAVLADHPEVSEAVLQLNDGERYAHYQRPAQPEPRERLLSGLGLLAPAVAAVSVPVEARGEVIAELRLTVDMTHTYQRVAMAVVSILLLVLLVFVLVLLLQSRLLARVLAPVQSLVASMRRVTDSADYSQRARVTSRDEVGELGNSFNAMMALIEERDRAMEHLALHDTLTGLVNRHYLRMRARLPGMEDGQRVALLYIDLDNFKHVNDTVGHNFGDRVLAAIANRLTGLTGKDDVLARFGGDEFVLCSALPTADDDAVALAERLRRAISAPLHLQGRELQLRASVGVAIAPLHGSSVNELLQKADAAMHAVKYNGRDGTQVWNAAITERANERFVLESELRQAMQAGQLGVVYQPIIDFGSGRVAGIEALVRWQHPERGWVPPSVFIPVAEDSGLIVQLGAWVLEQACRQVRHWHARYGRLHLAVNVSGRQFRDAGLVETVLATCERTGFPMELLYLELTESTLMHDTEAAAQLMQRLVALGIKLSLDDFGTGYSSLAYLKRFPLHKLKIDRSFVKDLPHNPDDGAIVKAIVNLARALDMQVLAEGIESDKQHRVLAAIGCDYGQGYYYGEPLWPRDFESLMAPRSADKHPVARDSDSRY